MSFFTKISFLFTNNTVICCHTTSPMLLEKQQLLLKGVATKSRHKNKTFLCKNCHSDLATFICL